MEKIKIAFFAEILLEDFDGASRTMFQLIRRIPAAAFEFLFICGKGPSEIMGYTCTVVPSITLPFNRNYTMALPYLAESQIHKKLSDFLPDVIHIATPSPLGHFALDFAKDRNLPVLTIYHTHFIAYLDYYLSKAPFLVQLAKDKMAAAQKSFYNRCDVIYVPSESISTELRQIGIEPKLMKIWKRGINTTLFTPVKKASGLAQSITGNNLPCILFASRLVWEKNLETLIRIYDHCQQNELAYNFIVAGDGTAKNACQRRMKNAFFTGTLDHQKLSDLYASCDVFVFTSISETYGNVVLEAMASGLPCVIADGGGSADLIRQAENGFKCDPENAAEYVTYIQAMLTNPDLGRWIAESGRRYSLGLDWDNLARIYFLELQGLAGIHQAEYTYTNPAK